MSRFNAAAWLLDDKDPDRVAIRVRGESLTYGGVRDLVARTAGGLHEAGVQPEQRVLLVLLDSPEFVAAFLGAMWIGAIPVPVNPLLRGSDIASIAADARPRIAIVSPEREGVTAELDNITDVVVGGPPAADAVAPFETSEDYPGFWLCTSGTTGSPKLAMHRHADPRVVAEGFSREVLGITGDDVFYSIGPMFHAYGLGNSLFFPFAAGAKAVLERSRPPTPNGVAQIMAAERPTLFFAVPTFYATLLAADLPPETFASVRHAFSAAEPLPADLFHRFRDRFGLEVLDGIGSTEMTHCYLSNRPGRARAGTSGTVVGGYRVRITDDEGHDASVGQLWVSGESMATGYWCRTAETRSRFVGEWLRTGDMYERDADGYYTYLGRADDMFKVSGEWVSPAEVEAALIECAGVLEAAVVPYTDGDGLLKGAAFIVCAPDASPTEVDLASHCRERLAGYKRPKRFKFVDALPKTATGKIKRHLLREGQA